MTRWDQVLLGNSGQGERWAYCERCGSALLEAKERVYDRETGAEDGHRLRKYCPRGHQLIDLSADGPLLP